MESELFKVEPRLEEDEKELIPLASFRKKKGKQKSGKQSQVKEVIMYTLTTSSYSIKIRFLERIIKQEISFLSLFC